MSFVNHSLCHHYLQREKWQTYDLVHLRVMGSRRGSCISGNIRGPANLGCPASWPRRADKHSPWSSEDGLGMSTRFSIPCWVLAHTQKWAPDQTRVSLFCRKKTNQIMIKTMMTAAHRYLMFTPCQALLYLLCINWVSLLSNPINKD